MLYILLALGFLSASVISALGGLLTATAWYWFILIFLGLWLGSFLGWLIVYVLFLLIVSVLVDKKKEVTKPSRFYGYFVKETMSLLLFFSRSKVHMTGVEQIPTDTKYLLVANHLSNFDPITCLTQFGKNDLIFVSKPENFNLPIAGSWIYRAGFMAIDRESPKNALVTINKAADYLKNQVVSVGIFPEGTRNKSGEGLLEFKNGAFKIATKAKVPIVVATLKNTRQVQKNFPWKRTHIYMDVEVISKEEVMESNTAQLSDRVYKIMMDNLEKRK